MGSASVWSRAAMGPFKMLLPCSDRGVDGPFPQADQSDWGVFRLGPEVVDDDGRAVCRCRVNSDPLVPPVPLRCGHRRDGLGLRPVHAIGTRRNANAPSTSAPYEPANRSSAGSISTRRTTTSPSSGILSACRTGTLEFGSESSESSSASLRSAWRPSRGFAHGHPDRLRHNPTRHCASR